MVKVQWSRWTLFLRQKSTTDQIDVITLIGQTDGRTGGWTLPSHANALSLFLLSYVVDIFIGFLSIAYFGTGTVPWICMAFFFKFN